MTHNSEGRYDDLEYTPDDVFLLDSRPFTGVAIDRNDRGVKISEVPFLDGRQHGVTRAWHSDGKLSLERPYIHSDSHGVANEWFDDGSLKSETTYEYGVMMRRELHDRQGKVIETFERQSSDVLYQNVLKRRENP